MMLDPFLCSLLAGSAAGTSVDVTLFPLDTLKTRLQSAKGFRASGGFKGIYRGLGPAFVGSAPNAAIFFCTYDASKARINSYLQGKGINHNSPGVHMVAATLGETASCFVRVPVEIVKQRRQVGLSGTTGQIISGVLRDEGPWGFYRGYLSTLLREIPFSLIQFPLWEYLKKQVAQRNLREVPDGDSLLCACSPFQSSLCGAIAGGVSAALTTPLDVAKTRIMLAEVKSQESQGNILPVLRLIVREKGFRGLFAGVVPRTLWISLGGSIFFGTYELVKSIISPDTPEPS